MFEPLFGFTATDCTGLTDKLFFDEKPQLARVKGTTKKAEAFGLFVYPNSVPICGSFFKNTQQLLPVGCDVLAACSQRALPNCYHTKMGV